MKRFYSVKEVSEILGFSTNTVYKYLDEGKLKGRRIGKGRFKIPHEEIEPYLSATEKVEETIQKVTNAEKISGSIRGLDLEHSNVSPGRKDFLFYLLLLSLNLLGMGILFFIITPFSFMRLNEFFSSEAMTLGSVILSLSYLVAGGLVLAEILNEKIRKHQIPIHIYVALVLGAGALGSFLAGRYETFVILTSLMILQVVQLVKGYKNYWGKGDFYREFLLLTIIAFFLGGLLILLNPESLPLMDLRNWVSSHRAIFSIIWFGLINTPLVILYSQKERSGVFNTLIFILIVILALAFAFNLSIEGKWASAYGSYKLGIFGVFLFWWTRRGSSLKNFYYHTIIFSFLWTAAGIILGITGLFVAQNNLKISTWQKMKTDVSQVSSEINNWFDQAEATVIKEIKDENIASVIENGDEEENISTARGVYSQIPGLRRVLLLDKNGITLGAYPRNSVVQGTNFSSRDFFRIVTSTQHAYVSSVYEAITNVPIVVFAHPVFRGNNMIGMTVLVLDLEGLSQKYQYQLNGWKLYAYDENNKYVLSPEPERLGLAVDKEIVESLSHGYGRGEKFLRASDVGENPRWTVYAEKPAILATERLLTPNIVVLGIIAINSFIALSMGIALAKKR